MNKPLDAIVVRYAGYSLLFACVLYLLYCVRAVLPIFGLALLLAYAFEPLLRRMEAGGRSRGSSVAFVAVAFLLVAILAVTLLAAAWQQVQALSSNFPSYQSQVEGVIAGNQYRIQELRLPQNVKELALQSVQDFQKRAPALLGLRLQNMVAWVLGSLGAIGIALVLVPILTLYFMLEMNALRARSLMVVPAPYRRDVIEIADSINELLGRYVRGQIIVCSSFGLLCTLSFYLLAFRFGMDYPLVLGLSAALIYVVPYIGMAAIALSAGLTGYFSADSSPVTCAAIAVGCVVAFNLVIDYGVAPRVLGRGVGLHPLMVIFALLSGAQVGGIAGMILAVPVFASLRVIAIYLFPQLVAPLPEDPQPELSSHEQAVSDAQSAESVATTRRGVFAWLKRPGRA
jgi:predicted PurR-regulated permease PerM